MLLDRWSPFVAACVLMGLTPAEIDHDLGDVEAVWEIDPGNKDAALELYEHDRDYSQELRKLTEVIAINAAKRGDQDVSSSEIVAWALKTHTISSDSKVARAFDRDRFEEIYVTAVKGGITSEDVVQLEELADSLRQANEEIGRLISERDELSKKAKNTGKHYIEQRAQILAAALHCLARNREDCSDKKGKVTGAGLAKQVDDKRAWYGFVYDATDSSPTLETISDHVTKALSEAHWTRSEKI